MMNVRRMGGIFLGCSSSSFTGLLSYWPPLMLSFSHDGLFSRWPLLSMVSSHDGLFSRWPLLAMASSHDGLFSRWPCSLALVAPAASFLLISPSHRVYRSYLHYSAPAHTSVPASMLLMPASLSLLCCGIYCSYILFLLPSLPLWYSCLSCPAHTTPHAPTPLVSA
jgi:hypothetical protein